MDPTSRHRRSPSSDRFLDFSPPPPSAASFSLADEFNEDDVFFTDTDDAPHRRSPPDRPRHHHHARRASFPHPGILDALPSRDAPVLYRKPSISATPAKSIPAIPRPPPPSERDFTQSAPARKMQQSAPVRIPVLSRAVMMGRDLAVLDEEEMLPPHEIVARGSARSPKTTYSVLEGAGRTLKGRDLRQVRNAIWRQTGFLD